MTPTCLLNYRLFRPNRVTQVPIVKELHLFCVSSSMTDEVTLESFGNLLILNFLMLYDLVDPTFNEDLSDFVSPPSPLRQKSQQDLLSLPL